MSPDLPGDVVKYAETAIFTETTVPAKLTSVHDTKRGAWGKLVVREGSLDYVIPGPPQICERVEAGEFMIIEPEVKHRVEIIGPVRFQVEFYKRNT